MSALQKAALKRAHRTAVEYLCATIPAGVTITPTMLMNIDLKYTFYVFLAWLIMGILMVGGAYMWAVRDGLPEVQPAQEITSAEAVEMPVIEYQDNENYDDLYIDEKVDEGEDDEVE